MSPRSLRHAAERKAISEARQAANAANAQLSTGPRTTDGKAKSSVNALKTALTGRTVLLPTDDVAAYRQHVQHFADESQPVGPQETDLVQALADHAWRLNRIASLEMAIYAFGHEQFAEKFADRGELQAGFTQMHTFLHYEKQLRNLQIQEGRIRRNREKDTAELHRLQKERTRQQLIKASRTASISEPVANFDSNIGFDFSPAAPIRTATVSGSVVPTSAASDLGFDCSSIEWETAPEVDLLDARHSFSAGLTA